MRLFVLTATVAALWTAACSPSRMTVLTAAIEQTPDDFFYLEELPLERLPAPFPVYFTEENATQSAAVALLIKTGIATQEPSATSDCRTLRALVQREIREKTDLHGRVSIENCSVIPPYEGITIAVSADSIAQTLNTLFSLLDPQRVQAPFEAADNPGGALPSDVQGWIISRLIPRNLLIALKAPGGGSRVDVENSLSLLRGYAPAHFQSDAPEIAPATPSPTPSAFSHQHVPPLSSPRFPAYVVFASFMRTQLAAACSSQYTRLPPLPLSLSTPLLYNPPIFTLTCAREALKRARNIFTELSEAAFRTMQDQAAKQLYLDRSYKDLWVLQIAIKHERLAEQFYATRSTAIMSVSRDDVLYYLDFLMH